MHERPKINIHSPLFAIFLIVMVDVLGFTIILPLLPFYAETYGASPFEVGVLATTFAVCQLFSGPLLGRISDKRGRRKILMVSQVGTCLGFILLGIANTLPLIFLSRIIDGITAGNLTIAQAAIADVTAPEDRAKSFGIIGIAFGLGFIVGPAISAALSPLGTHYPAFVAAGLSATSVIATWRLLPEAPRKTSSSESAKSATKLMEFLKRSNMRWLLVEFLIFGFIFAGFTSGFAMFVERRFVYNGKPFGATEVSILFTYSGFLGLILQGFFIGPLVKRFGEAKLVAAGFGSMAVSYLLLGLSYNIPMLVVASTIGSFGNGVIRPALTALVSQIADADEQGGAMGATQSVVAFGQVFAPLISGGIINSSEMGSQIEILSFISSSLTLSLWAFGLGLLALLALAVRLFLSNRAIPLRSPELS